MKSDIKHDQLILGNWGFTALRALVALDMLVSTIYSILFSDVTLRESKVCQSMPGLGMRFGDGTVFRGMGTCLYVPAQVIYKCKLTGQENSFKILSR